MLRLAIASLLRSPDEVKKILTGGTLAEYGVVAAVDPGFGGLTAEPWALTVNPIQGITCDKRKDTDGTRRYAEGVSLPQPGVRHLCGEPLVMLPRTGRTLKEFHALSLCWPQCLNTASRISVRIKITTMTSSASVRYVAAWSETTS